MSQTRTLLTIVVLPLLFAAFAGCGGGAEQKATQTPTNPTTATPTQAAWRTPTGTATGTATGTPTGTATATVTVGDKTFTFENGTCDKGPDDAWLAVNIDQADSGEYFGLLIGAGLAHAPEGTKPAKGGGEFAGADCGVVSATFGGNSYVRILDEECKTTLDTDLKGGEFVGTTYGGGWMSGSFKC
jgi:hypothetical protein